jgi:hypothetical protein
MGPRSQNFKAIGAHVSKLRGIVSLTGTQIPVCQDVVISLIPSITNCE